MFDARLASLQISITAFAMLLTSVPSTHNPVTPSSTASGAPPEFPATTGIPHALASK